MLSRSILVLATAAYLVTNMSYNSKLVITLATDINFFSF
jgi:hypothetical protein